MKRPDTADWQGEHQTYIIFIFLHAEEEFKHADSCARYAQGLTKPGSPAMTYGPRLVVNKKAVQGRQIAS
jgi:hypothetical protein